MRFRPRTWLLFSLLLFTASYWMWMYAEKVNASRRSHAASTSPSNLQRNTPALTPVAQSPAPSASAAAKPKSYRLSNTRATEKQLLRSNHAIILRNALIDTDRPLRLNIPEHLKAKGAPGSYIVQSPQALDQRFYDRLARDGVKVVSYIPNNAALVQATPEQAKQMAADLEFQAVIPYEPYYKLATPLLPSAVAQDQTLSEALNVTALPGQRDAALAALRALGAQFMGEETGPFGTTLSVMVPPDKLVAVAQMPLAQEIEPYAPRRALNDLTRVTMGIATNTLYTTPNYMGLTGSNVTVNMNDTGVDLTHPDFQGVSGKLRLLGATNGDQTTGHGTHVAGIIMGNGSMSSTINNITNKIPGSVPGAGFQGKATNANLYVQSLGMLVGTTVADAFIFGGSLISDAYLQANASSNLGPTNLISNNSWGYDIIGNYDMHAASFDQATRDAQPALSGEQPLLFVFAAGPDGNGNDFGGGGQEGTITSPGTAKNVLTVGSLDAARFITNGVTFDDQSTNDIFFNWTDNNNLVSWFSSCGNVGLGTEGTLGRFKPDVVAPGMFVISCRASNYVDPIEQTLIYTYPYPNQQVLPGKTNDYPLAIPPDTEEVVISVTSNPDSPVPFPPLNIYGDTFTPPTTLLPGSPTTNFLVLTNLSVNQWYFGVTTTNGAPQPEAYDITFYVVITNDLGVSISNKNGYFYVISNLNSQLDLKKPGYMYQYGTSMAAGAVSGMLALMQQFLQAPPMSMTNISPALLKAMVINGSRSAEQQYDYGNFDNTSNAVPEVNEQGWGLPTLPACLPASLTNGNPSMLLVNQSTNDALATGQSQSYTINCSDPNATNFPIRATLVWTDPPGDPVAGIALVNNLALLITDASGTNLWLGNDFYSGDIFTEVNTGDLPDVINNVQNVYIDPSSVTVTFPLTVTVLGMRVNVNAATTVTNAIAQDYALVISSDDPLLTSGGLTISSNAPTNAAPLNLVNLHGPQFTNAFGAPLLSPPLLAFATTNYALVTVANSGIPLLHQRVGANEPNLYTNGPLYTSGFSSTYGPLGTNGNFVQWHFFVFSNNVVAMMTNTNTAGLVASNVAFTTFEPPDLATQISPRTNGADLDMYVSTNSGLTNLDPTVFAEMTTNDMSVGRGGTETVIYTNSVNNQVYYIGIKSEDQQAADFGFYGVAQQQPFSIDNPNGSVTATSYDVPKPIPDSPGPPALVFAFLKMRNPQLQKITATVGIEHGNPSDLYGTLKSPTGAEVTLNNFSGPPGGFTNTYNDLSDNTVPGSVNSDGPGTLKDYVSTSGTGVWILTEQDNALLQSGQVTAFSVTGYPQPLTLNFQVTIGAQEWFDDYIVVPDDATNLIISVSYVSGNGPVGIFITNFDDVGFNDFRVQPIVAPGGYLEYGLTNNPPLTGGFWYYGIYNYNATAAVTLNVQITFGLSLVPNLVQTYTNNTVVPLTTDGTVSGLCIGNITGQQVVDLSVGVRLTDPNLDDLVLQLTSPQGTSIVLFENRGGLLANGLGVTLTNMTVSTNAGTNTTTTNFSTNFVYTVFTEDTNLANVPIKFAPPPYAVESNYPLILLASNAFDVFTNLEDFYTNNTIVTSNAEGNYTNGQTVANWFVETNLLTISTVFTNVVTGTNPPVTNPPTTFLVTNQTFNEVSVWTDTNVTFDPTYTNGAFPPGSNYLSSNYLALASGRLSQTFPTVQGVAYEFTYFARSPGLIDWWPADDNVIDLVGTNDAKTTNITFDVGEVSRAFTFTNANSAVFFGTNTGNFGTNDFSIDFWIQCSDTNDDNIEVLYKETNYLVGNFFNIFLKEGAVHYTDSATNPGVSGGYVTDGLFHHVAVVRQTTNISTYFDGTLAEAVSTVIHDIDNRSNLVAGLAPAGADQVTLPGSLDELDLWNRALTPAEINAIYQAGTSGKYSTNWLYPNFLVAFDGVATNDILIPNFSETNWQYYTNSFIATSNQTTIELIGNPLGVLLDNLKLVQLPYTNYNNYYLPEEPMAPLIGQNPEGCWTLSIWDTRTDSLLTNNGTLLSWDLQVTTSSTNVNLIVLTNGIPYVQSSTNTPIIWFGVDVPLTANYATNMLSSGSGSGPMNLLFNQNALPNGTLPGDYTLLANTNSGTNIISTQGAPPPLVPGQRYFLGVQNLSGGPETFTLTVQFDVSSSSTVTTLTNGLAIDPVIGTNGPTYYSLIVPTNSTMATIQLLNLTNGEVDLYVRKGLPVPTTTSFDYASLNEGSNDQFIVITTNSEPVPLPSVNPTNVEPQSPTTWYISVVNPGTNTNVNYTILGTYVTNGVNDTRGVLDVINLNKYFTNGAYTYYVTNTYPEGVPPGYPTNLVYALTIPQTSLGQVQFTVTNISTNGNLQLLVGSGELPTPQEFYIGSFNAGTNNQSVTILTNSALPTLSNTWYVTVPNTSSNNVIYSITAIVTNGPLTEPLVWDGNGGTNWNYTETDWHPVGGTNETTFNDTDPVTFDDSLTNGRSTINIPAKVQPGSMTFSNTAITYTFVGPGIIGGSGGLDVLNGGIVILDNSGNTFTGAVVLSNGTLQIGNNDANGSIIADVSNSLPGTLAFERSDDFAYAGSISGNGTLVQNGAGILTIAGLNTNLYGAVNIQQGTLRLGAPNALGVGSNAPITVSPGATLDLNGISGNELVNVSGTGVGGHGAIVNNGSSVAIPGISYMIMASSNVTIGGFRRWDLRSQPGDSADLLPTNDCYLSTFGFPWNLTKVGPNFIGLVSCGVDPALANIDVQGGTLDFEGTTSSLGNPTNTLTMETGASLELYNASNALNKVIIFQDGSTDENRLGANVISGPVILGTNALGGPGTVTLYIEQDSLSVFNTISGPGNLVMTGGQSLYLSASNTYRGTTLVNNGTIFLTNAGSIGLSTNITISTNGIMDATGLSNLTFRVGTNQTLQGFGFVNGLLSVAGGGAVAPGSTNLTGVLAVSTNISLAGTSFFKIDNAPGETNDVLESVSGSITYGGLLAVSNMTTNAFTNGQSFQLFSASNYFGMFTNVTPQPAIGLTWNTSLLTSNGTLFISTGMPAFSAPSISGTNFIFTVTNGIPGGMFTLLSTTNLAQPWMPVTTGNFSTNGTFTFDEPFSKANAPEFFSIQQP